MTQAALNHGLSLFLSQVLSTTQLSQIREERVPESLVGLAFREVFLLLNDRLEDVLLAVARDGEMHTNPPRDFALQSGDSVFILGPGSARDLATLGRSEARRSRKARAR
jgi:Trk K+ transport system NAD-binding subunit